MKSHREIFRKLIFHENFEETCMEDFQENLGKF